jgi:hypothetical protein
MYEILLFIYISIFFIFFSTHMTRIRNMIDEKGFWQIYQVRYYV